MKVKKIDNTYVIRLEVGDEITDCLKLLSIREGITAATVQGIGAVDNTSIGYYSLEEKKYNSKVYNRQFEMISLNGNISIKNGEPYLHLHAAFSDENYSLIAGHLNYAVISITAEIFVTVLSGEISRCVSEKTGLNIFDI